jgi:hypothetical protein
LAGLWSNIDSKLSQEINALNGTCHCSLEKFSCKKLALKLGGFVNETPRGDRLASAPLSKGPDGPALDVQATILNVAPVSTKYLLFVNSSIEKLGLHLLGNAWLWQWHVLIQPLNR